jgi:hypothetical protein
MFEGVEWPEPAEKMVPVTASYEQCNQFSSYIKIIGEPWFQD